MSHGGLHWAMAALIALAVLLWPRRPTGSLGTQPTLSDLRSRLSTAVARIRGPDAASDLAVDAAYCELLALALRAGLPAPAALQVAADAGVDERDGDRAAGPLRGGHLLQLAWAQSQVLGTPLADAVSICAGARQADHDHELRRRAAASGPQASMLLLTALPTVGPLLAAAVGLGPDLGDPLVLMMLAAGYTATALGWWWARSIIRRAGRPPPLRRPPPALRPSESRR